MKHLLAETSEHFSAFDTAWPKEMLAVLTALRSEKNQNLQSYRRIATLQAWRTVLFDQKLDDESNRFVLEAQNDALYSHVFARMGAWRASLQSLRSTVENVLAALYYMDHPIELSRWLKGGHRMNFQDYIGYFGKHPRIDAVGEAFAGLSKLNEEYSTLSRAVHGSAEPFRMTGSGGTTRLWVDDKARLGAWATREKHVMVALNRLLLVMFADDLNGAKLPAIRKSISLIFTDKLRGEIKKTLRVTLPTR